jgi:intermediate cleaving peptidase 55
MSTIIDYVKSGIYVPANDPSERWPKHFRGIGIRIEDSVCVDSASPFVLSTEAVKEVSLFKADCLTGKGCSLQTGRRY